MSHSEEYDPTKTRGLAVTDWVALLRERARSSDPSTGYVFLKDGETEYARLSFAELDRRARAIAARIQTLAAAGERALLLYPPGPDFIEAFFGCLYAGIVAVPVPLPTRRQASRLTAVIADAAPALVLGRSEGIEAFRGVFSGRTGSVWVATDSRGAESPESWRPPALGPDSLAFLQYTSGSTGDPKGVMVSHGNLLANQESIRQAFGHSEHSTVVGWLPLYHDMGLIGNVLQPLYVGSRAVLMSPLDFLEKPVRWLRAISSYRAATSGGPNFAYDLCVRKVAEEDKCGLDLSSWSLAFNGSEPVRGATLERFSNAFRQCGFRRESFFPCYGLAEATLFVSGDHLETMDSRPGAGTAADRTPGLPAPVSGPVSCGRTRTGDEVRIVDPDTLRLRPEGRTGEIWVAGRGVAQGYRNRPEESESLFRAKLADTGTESQGSYLRTGDLGFLQGGRLHVTGRIKDLIILRGRNIHPEDVEHALTERVAKLQPGGCAAFAIEDGDEETLAVVAELRREAIRSGDFEAVFEAIRQVLAEELDVSAAHSVLVPPGAIPKTSSGKQRRRACKQALLDGVLPVLARTNIAAEPTGEFSAPGRSTDLGNLLRIALASLAPERRTPLIARFLRDRIAKLSRTDPVRLSDTAPLRSLGLDSLKTVELKHEVETGLGIDAPLSLFLSDTSLWDAAAVLSREEVSGAVTASGAAPITSPERPSLASQGGSRTYPLSFPQLAIWSMQQMEPDNNTVYNLHLALSIDGGVDIDRLRETFDHLTKRHDLLRTVYRTDGDTVLQAVLDPAEFPTCLAVVDACGWPEAALQEAMALVVHEPFDLEAGPVLRARLYCHEDGGHSGCRTHTLLLCAQHIALDLWSLLIFLDETRKVYAALAAHREPSLPVLSASYRDFIAWQGEYLAGPQSGRAWDFWRNQLAGELPVLALPTDHPHPRQPDYRGASVAIRLSAEASEQVRGAADRHGVTLFTLLLAAYQVLLHRYCRQSDLIVGIPASGRSRSGFAPILGNFVNPLPLRSRPSAAKSFVDYLAEVHETLLGALEHQDFPFPLMVERLQPGRNVDHWPIYQTLFVLQRAQTGLDDDLAALALGEDGEPWSWGDWRARSLAIRNRIENFDLKLMAAESGDGLLFSFQYRSALFEPETIARLARHFQTLLEGIVADPAVCLGDLPLMTPAECRRVLIERNATAAGGPEEERLHGLFEAWAARTPEAIAVVSGEERLSYGDLNARADRLARRLRALGAGPEARIGLHAARSAEAMVGILGILKAGAAYVPLDPGQPRERIAETLADCGAVLVLTQFEGELGVPARNLGEAITADIEAEASLPLVPPDAAAYVIYTSGSTGRPKGVVISHRNAVASTLARFSFYPEPVRGFLLLSAFAFDSSVAGIFWTLSQGGRLCIPPEGSHQDVERLADLAARERLTHVLGLPSLYGLLLESADGGRLNSLTTAIVAGEACPPGLPARHYQALPRARLYNEYGPTEATVWCSAYEIPAATTIVDRPVSIGGPVASACIYLLDERLNPVPIGVPGELCISGSGIARGYYGRPEFTAERFLPDPFDATGGRLYRSGDLARWRPDGLLEFLGRTDHQVKIRGFRIELGEIETRLREHPEVREAVAIVREDEPGDKRLVAYVTVDDSRGSVAGEDRSHDASSLVIEHPALAAALREFLKDRLPGYMIPAVCVILPALPVTPTGKLDRQALPVPDRSRSRQQYAPPRDAVETLLAGIWAEVLRADQVGIHDNFFDLGGDSILAIQAASRAHKAGLAITPRQLFQHQTVAELAVTGRTDSLAEPGGEPAPAVSKVSTAGRFSLSRLEPEEVEALPGGLGEIEDIYPLTPLQEGMLFHTLMAPGSGIYLMQDRFELHGRVEIPLFREAWDRVIRRHPVLRTGFVWETRSVPHQIVYRTLELPFEFHDWRELSKDEQDSRLEALLRAEREQGFDFARPPLLRLRLFRLGETRYRFVRSHHHILLDAWCTSLVLTEFKTCYDALAAASPPIQAPATPFRNYLGWLRLRDNAAAESFWRGYLAGFEEPTPLVIDRLGTTDESAEVADCVAQLPETMTRRLYELAQRHRLTPNTFVQGAFALLLSRYAGRREILFGITVAGRPAELPEVESILGLFINGLPLRVRIAPGQSVTDFLHGLMQQNLDLRQYEYSALTQIQTWCDLPRGQDLFQHLLTFENAPIDPSLRERTGSFGFTDVDVRTHTNYPVTVMAIPEDRLHLQISYRKTRFETADIERMLRHLQSLLVAIIEHPDRAVGELSMLDESEFRRVTRGCNRTHHEYPEPTDLVARFEAQVERTPDAVAAACGDQTLSYTELNTRSNRLAHALAQLGVGPESLVALLNDRGLEFLTLMLAVFKAGGAYLPLDPTHPDARLKQVLEQSRSGLVLVGEPYRERVTALRDGLGSRAPTFRFPADLTEAKLPGANPPHRHRPESLAFVIFTSGSTGTPKGAMVEHRGMFNNLITKVPTLGLTESDVIAQTAGQCFDISVWQHLTALACGGRVEIFPDDTVREPRQLLAGIAERGVTILEAVPSMIQALLDLAEGLELPRLRWLIACGEAFPPDLCRRWMQRFPHLRVLNAYGPAECSDDVSYYEVPALPEESATVVPVGWAVHNTQLYLLDPELNPVPVGVPGEICVAGIQVGRGYLHRPDLTAERFVPNPFAGLLDDPGSANGWQPRAAALRLYRTGDLGRYRPDGAIEFLGRIDHQLKLRGFRIEPGEIEAQLLRHPQVAQAVVLAQSDGRGGKRLVAYVGSRYDDEAAFADELRTYLGGLLPGYMVPAAFVVRETLPLGGTGKIDRKALPAPDIAGQHEDRYVAPGNPTEEILAGIWREVLDVPQVGVRDVFFDLGGHSLLAVQVLARVRAAFGVEIPLGRLFEAATIEQLAEVVEEFLIRQIDELSEEETLALLEADS